MNTETSILLQLGGERNASYGVVQDADACLLTDVNMLLFTPFLSVLCLLTIVGNVLVLLAVKMEKKLQTVNNMYYISLASADLVVGSAVMPIAAVYTLSGYWVFESYILCQLWLALDYIASTASILNLLVLCLDRYWSLNRPLASIRQRTRRVARILIVSLWAVSLLWAIPVFGWRYFFADGFSNLPDGQCDTEYRHSTAFKLVTAAVNFFLPLVIMFVLYGRVFYIVRRRVQFQNSQCLQDFVPTPEPTVLPKVSTDSVIDPPRAQSATPRLRAPLRRCESPRLPSTPVSISHDQQSLCIAVPILSNTPPQRHERERINPAAERESPSAAAASNVFDFAIIPVEDAANEVSTEQTISEAGDSRRRRMRHSLSLQNAPIVEDPEAAKSRCSSTGQSSWVRRGGDKQLTKTSRMTLSCSNVKSEFKAARQLGVIMGAFTVCFLPYFVSFVALGFCSTPCVSQCVMQLVTWIGYTNSTLNPFLYPLCNQQFRMTFARFWRAAVRVLLCHRKSDPPRNGHLVRTMTARPHLTTMAPVYF